MAITLVETPGGASANTYATLVEAKTFLTARLGTDDWDNADDDTRSTALAQAAWLLDAVYSRNAIVDGKLYGQNFTNVILGWTGTATDAVQALCWPRNGMFTRNGFAIANTIIPQELKNAQAEFARQLITKDTSVDNDVKVQGINSIKAGPVSLSFNKDIDIKTVPDVVMYLLVNSWYVTPVSVPDPFVLMTDKSRRRR